MMERIRKIVILYAVLGTWTLVSCAATPVNKKDQFYYRSLIHNGLKRTYMVHIPPTYNGDKAIPLFIFLHGGGGSGENAEKFSGISRQSDKDGFILIYPDAVGHNWNDGRAVKQYQSHRQNIDDVGFIAALIDAMKNDYAIDPGRVYVSGASNGGMMTIRLACESADKITAIAPVISAMPENLAAQCAPSRPIPVLMINGTEDPMVPWEGGHVLFGRKKLGKILSTPDTVQFWVSHNGCDSAPKMTWEPDIDPDDETRARKSVYSGCKENVEVVFYEIRGGGHAWPGGPIHFPEFITGRPTHDIDANQIIWDFFKNYSF